MKTTHLRQWLISLLFIAAFGACTDHRVPAVTPGLGTSRLRVKTIIQDRPNSPTEVSAFSYDGQGRLGLIITFQLPDSIAGPAERSVYQYDAQNRLTQLRRDIVRTGGFEPNLSETYTVNYNAAGQVSSLNHSPSTFSIRPLYTPDNRVSGYSKNISVGGLISNGGGAFTFSGNNLTNATERYTIIRAGGSSMPVFDSSVNTTYTFDDKVNPFHGVYIIPAPFRDGFAYFQTSTPTNYYTYYGGVNNLLNLSQNNVLSAVAVVGSASATTSYAYTYNSNNLPTSRTTTTSGAVVETLRFEYETY